MTSLSTPSLSALLLGAISTALAGCSDAAGTDDLTTGGPRNGPLAPNVTETPDPEDPPGPDNEETETTTRDCVPEAADTKISLVANLNPVTKTDFVGNYGKVRDEQTDEIVFGARETSGTECSIATDPDECLASFAQLTAPERTTELDMHLIVTDESGARELTEEADIKSFLGTIDTVNEAYMILRVGNITGSKDCDGVIRDGKSFKTDTVRHNGCGEDSEKLSLAVRPDGSVSESLIELVPSTCAIGRLTDGVCFEPADPNEAKDLGAYLSSVCHLETAAVAAFMQLAQELSRHGAPERLIQGAHEAAAEEIEHAKETHRLALVHGGIPMPVAYKPQPTRSLLDLAIENAQEGCVRELYGAACAGFQARNAADEELRRAWAKIAQEETGHAEWSLELHAWLHSQLSDREWELVQDARAQAVEGLRKTVSRSPDPALAHRAGIPTAQQAELLFEALAPAFAA